MLPADDVRRTLVADCRRCAALCCVLPGFTASADFAIDKPPGVRCPNLLADHRCSIHAELRGRGFPGCVAYDCFGAGQRATELFGGPDQADTGDERLTVAFEALLRLHRLAWYLAEAVRLPAAAPLRPELEATSAEVETLRAGDAEALSRSELRALRDRVDALLTGASRRVRTEDGGEPLDAAGADLIGADLRRTRLRAADLRGALLLGADVRGVDLGLADLRAADLRGADLRGADLRDTLFLTRPQVASARTDPTPRLPFERRDQPIV